MDTFLRSYTYAIAHSTECLVAFQQHLLLVFVPVAIGLCVGLPLGLWSARSDRVSLLFINGFNMLRVIPSLAVLFVAIPYFGLSFTAAAIALTLLTIPPILVSTDTAFRTVAAPVKEAAYGMGMSPVQVLRQVEIPLALPVILVGVKTAVVEAIASATLAAFIGVGGFGMFIVRGFALYDPAILWVGAVPVALMAIAAEVSLSLWQRQLS
jgi:osmoprotectant transport system permease protein